MADKETPSSTCKYVIRTMSYRGSAQTTINLTEEEAKEAFMDQYGEEPTHTNTVYCDGVFHPNDIKPMTSVSSSCGDLECGDGYGCLCYTR